MFPSRFFPDRYFAPRYFPKVGADAAPDLPGRLCSTFVQSSKVESTFTEASKVVSTFTRVGCTD